MRKEYLKPRMEVVKFGHCASLLQSSDEDFFDPTEDEISPVTGEIGFNQTFSDNVSPKV